MIDGFRHKGLEELHLAGKTRRIGAEYVKKCVRILQLLEVAAQPEEMNIAGFRFHGLRGNPQRWSVRDRKLPDHLRLVRRKRPGCRF